MYESMELNRSDSGMGVNSHAVEGGSMVKEERGNIGRVDESE